MKRREFFQMAGGVAALPMLSIGCASLQHQKETRMKPLAFPPDLRMSVGDLQYDCIKACLDSLGLNVTTPWLAGTTAEAFVIALAGDACLSSVESCLDEARADGTMARLGRNLGYELTKHGADRQEGLQRAVDSGFRCFGYYNFCYQLLCGYDENGFYIGPGVTNAGQGPKPFKDLPSIWVVSPAEQSQRVEDAVAVKDALTVVLRHNAEGLPGATHSGEAKLAYGPAAYERWVKIMYEGNHAGTWRLSLHYLRARQRAVEFLVECEGRLGGDVAPLFKQAASHYRVVRDNLQPVWEAFREGTRPVPFGEPGSPHAKAAAQLKAAADAEAKGLKVLERIVGAL